MNPYAKNEPQVKVAVQSKTVSDTSLQLVVIALIVVLGLVLLINGAASGF